MKALQDLGVYHVVQPEFEAGLEFTRQTLLHLDMPAADIQHFTDNVRQELYRPLYDLNSEYKTLSQLQNADHLLELKWVALDKNSPITGKTIGELQIRTKTGVTVVGVIRKDVFYSNPTPDFSFLELDMVGFIGRKEELHAFQQLIELQQ